MTKIPATDAPAASTDPLLRAIIEKLPAADQPFAPEARAAWLRMLINGLEVVYGPVGLTLELVGGPAGGAMTATPMPAAMMPAPALAVAVSAGVPASALRVPLVPTHFAIGTDNIARRLPSGDRIMPGNLGSGDTLYDYRGEHGDLASIEWSDGSRGIKGLSIDISSTPPVSN